MNPNTLEVRDFPSQAEAEHVRFTVPIPPSDAEAALGMTYAQARAWLARREREARALALESVQDERPSGVEIYR